MLATKGMRFPIDIILMCIRWYSAYPLSYRHLEEMMQERGVFVDHSFGSQHRVSSLFSQSTQHRRAGGLTANAKEPAGMHQVDEYFFQRTLARMQVLELNAKFTDLFKQRGNAGFFCLGIEGVNQRMAALGQLQG